MALGGRLGGAATDLDLESLALAETAAARTMRVIAVLRMAVMRNIVWYTKSEGRIEMSLRGEKETRE